MMRLINAVHDSYVHHRRIRRLADLLSNLIPEGNSVLDVGCGDGLLARRIQAIRHDVRVSGIDVLVRDTTHIPVQHFDGRSFPENLGQADVVMFVDVLHHTDDPMVLLREAARVARRAILIKDHTRDGLLAGATLRVMDYVGNAHHRVILPYNYWPGRSWHEAFRELGLTVRAWEDDLKLYPRWADWVFGRKLHFIALLEPLRGATGAEATERRSADRHRGPYPGS
jgi:SAM-dependent methyltransferase